MFKFVQKADFKNISSSHPAHDRKTLWLLPFFGFAIGYVLAGLVLHKSDFATPNIIGKSLREGVEILSKNHLGIRLLQQRQDATLPEGTILDQLPRSEQKIRSNQHVFVTISTKQPPIHVIDFWGKKSSETMTLIAQHELDAQIIKVPAAYPDELCIAQLPAPGQPLKSKKMILYFSDGKIGLSIMPNLRGFSLNSVQDALSKYDIRAEIFHTQTTTHDHSCSTCKIIDQQPVPGAIIDLRRGLHFQFKVATQS